MPEADPDPHVQRTIRTPKAVISIRGTLDECDKLYRATNKALLACGYTIPKPSDDPWREYGSLPIDDSDHLRRRVADLEQQIADSESHELIQEIRRTTLQLTLDRDMWASAFRILDQAIASALTTLQDGHTQTVHEAIVTDILTLGS